MFAKRLVVAIAIYTYLIPTLAFSQSRAEQTQALAQRAADLATENKRALGEISKFMQVILASNEEKRRTGQYVDGTGKVQDQLAKSDADEISVKAEAAENNLNDQKLDRALTPELRKRLAECTGTLKKEFGELMEKDPKPSLSEIQAAVASCDSAEVQKILDDLEEQRRQTLDAWGECRDTLISSGNFDPKSISIDPSQLARGKATDDVKKQIEDLKKQTEGLSDQALACRDRMSDLFEDLQNQEDSAAAMASMMNFAATACMSSGGNPYVCGALFLVAILASLFSSGSGDGDGDGESDGTGQKGDGNNMAGSGPRTNSGDSPAVSSTASDTTGSDATAIPSDCEGANCSVICKPVASSDVMECSANGTSFRIDPSKIALNNTTVVEDIQSLSLDKKKALSLLRSKAQRSTAVKLEFCAPNSRNDIPSGLIVSDGTMFYPMTLVEINDSLSLNPVPTGSPLASTDIENRCRGLP